MFEHIFNFVLLTDSFFPPRAHMYACRCRPRFYNSPLSFARLIDSFLFICKLSYAGGSGGSGGSGGTRSGVTGVFRGLQENPVRGFRDVPGGPGAPGPGCPGCTGGTQSNGCLRPLFPTSIRSSLVPLGRRGDFFPSPQLRPPRSDEKLFYVARACLKSLPPLEIC